MSDDKVASLGARRALAKADSGLWTVEEALRHFLSLIGKGEVSPKRMVLHWTDDDHSVQSLCVNVTYEEHVTILEAAKLSCLLEMMQGG